MALGQDVADYKGQIMTGSNATFNNLSPGGMLTYDVYVRRTDTNSADYQVTGGSFSGRQ